MEQKFPLPPFTYETAIQKVQMAEDKLNIRGFDNNTIYIGLHEIPIGNAYRADFF